MVKLCLTSTRADGTRGNEDAKTSVKIGNRGAWCHQCTKRARKVVLRIQRLGVRKGKEESNRVKKSGRGKFKWG